MASFLQRIILITLIFTIVIPISGHRDISENKNDWGDYSYTYNGDNSEIENDGGDDSEIGHYLKDLSSETKNPKQSWKIIKPETSRFTDTDSRNVASVILDLAIEKSNEIKGKLVQLHQDSGDDALKEKYDSCSNNYNDANRNLVIAKTNLQDSDDYQKISNEIDDVVQELRNCRHLFKEKSYDPAHIRDRNREIGLYTELVRTATNRFLNDKNRDVRKT